MTASTSGNSVRSGVAVELRGLQRRYRDVTALDRFDISVAAGEFVVLLGPSGCGKTTALRALAGLEPLDGGSVLIGGKDVTALPSAKRNIGMVFQNYSLFPNLTAVGNVEFGLRVRKLGKRERHAKAMTMLELVGLSAEADRYAHQLSGGQQQRVALARALAVEPEVLLLDEPLSALDAKVRHSLREEIKRIQTTLGITTFFVTHDQEEALAIADRIAVMRSGRLEQFASPLDVYASPSSEFVAEFVGTVNRLSGVVVDRGVVDTEQVGSVSFSDPDARYQRGDVVEVLLRPEAVGVLPLEEGPFVVTSSVFLGTSVRTVVRNDDGRSITAVLSAAEATRVAVGGRVSLLAQGSAILLLPKAGRSHVRTPIGESDMVGASE